MSVTAWWDEIAQLAGSAVPGDAAEASLADELLGGAWWTACSRAAEGNAEWLADVTADHPALRLLADFEPGAEVRALAAAHAADAGRRQRHGLPGASRALAVAACLWSGNIVPTDLDAPHPEWAWTPVSDLAARVQPGAQSQRTIRLGVTVPDAITGPTAGNLCVTPTDDGELHADPVAMMFADVDPAVLTEIEHAWHWAANRDRFRSGSGCRWSIVNSAGRPLRYVPELVVGAVAAVAMGYAFHLVRGTRREPRLDTQVAAGMLRSGALTSTDEVVRLPGSGRIVVHPTQSRDALPTGVPVRTATTASEAIRHLRRPRYLLVTVAAVLVVALVVGFFTVLGAVNGADTERKATASLAARLAVESDRQYVKAPDKALELALASYRLAPDSAQTQTAVLQAMYRDARFGGVLPAAPGNLRALAMSDHTTAVGMDDGSVSVYDEAAHRVARTDHDHKAAVRSLVFSPDSRLLASSSDDGTIVVRDGDKAPTTLSGAGAMAFSPDSRLLVSAGDDGAIVVNDLTAGTARTLDHRNTPIESVTFLSATTLAAGGDDKKAVIYDLTTGAPTVTFTSASAVTSVTSNGTGLLFTDFAGELHFGDPRTGKETHPAEKLTLDARAVARTGHGIVVRSPVEIAEFSGITPSSAEEHLFAAGPSYPTRSALVAVSPDGKRLAIPSSSGAILLWRDPHGDRSITQIHDLTGGFPVPGTDLLLVSAGGFIVKQSQLALVRRDGRVLTTQKVDQLNGVFNTPMAYSSRFRIVTALSRGTATVFRLDGETLVKAADLKATTEDGAITATTIDEPHSRILVARSGALTAIPLDGVDHPQERLVYRTATRINQILPFPSGHDLGLVTLDGVPVVPVGADGFVTDAGQRLGNRTFIQAVTPDDNTVTVSTADGSISTYTRADGAWTETRLQGHQGSISNLTAFGDLVVSAGRDDHVIVSNAHTGRTVVDIRLDSFTQPHTVWRDGDTIRVSHSAPISDEAVFTLEPAAAARTACTMAAWTTTVGDVAPDAVPATRGVPLCAAT